MGTKSVAKIIVWQGSVNVDEDWLVVDEEGTVAVDVRDEGWQGRGTTGNKENKENTEILR